MKGKSLPRKGGRSSSIELRRRLFIGSLSKPLKIVCGLNQKVRLCCALMQGRKISRPANGRVRRRHINGLCSMMTQFGRGARSRRFDEHRSPHPRRGAGILVAEAWDCGLFQLTAPAHFKMLLPRPSWRRPVWLNSGSKWQIQL